VALQTARNINGVSFNGTADITLPTVNTSGTQSIAGAKTFTESVVVSGNVTATNFFGNGSNLTGITPTTDQVLSATAGLTAGGVGTYAILRRTARPSDLTLGATYAGSDLRYQALQGVSFSGGFELQSQTIPTNTLSGTWRSLSQVPTTTDGNWAPVGLFVRIS